MSDLYGGRLGAILKKYPKVHCPVCPSKQIQITNYLEGDAGYKCRSCKQAFTLPFNGDYEDDVLNRCIVSNS